MKKTAILFSAIVAIVVSSCGGQNAQDSASSTPIDSTNLHGTAPAQYGDHDPADPDAPRYQGRYDTGIRANNASSEDSAMGRHQ